MGELIEAVKVPFLVSGEGRLHPALLQAYGPIRAEMLQHVHYFCCGKNPGMFHDGYWWMFYRVAQWVDHFRGITSESKPEGIVVPYRTMKWHIAKLTKGQAWVVGHYTKGPALATNWFRINYPQVLRDLNSLHQDKFKYEMRSGIPPTIYQVKVLSPQEIVEAQALEEWGDLCKSIKSQENELKMVKTPKVPTTVAKVQEAFPQADYEITQEEMHDLTWRGFEKVWRKALLANNHGITFVPKWLGKEQGQVKTWLKALQEHQDKIVPMLIYTLEHWGRFTKFVAESTGFKNSMPSPNTNFFTQHIGWAMDMYLRDHKAAPAQEKTLIAPPPPPLPASPVIEKKGGIVVVVKKASPAPINPEDSPIEYDELVAMSKEIGHNHIWNLKSSKKP